MLFKLLAMSDSTQKVRIQNVPNNYTEPALCMECTVETFMYWAATWVRDLKWTKVKAEEDVLVVEVQWDVQNDGKE